MPAAVDAAFSVPMWSFATARSCPRPCRTSSGVRMDEPCPGRPLGMVLRRYCPKSSSLLSKPTLAAYARARCVRLTASASATASIEPTECPGVLSGCAGSASVLMPTSDSCRWIPYTVLYWLSECRAACSRCAKRQRWNSPNSFLALTFRFTWAQTVLGRWMAPSPRTPAAPQSPPKVTPRFLTDGSAPRGVTGDPLPRSQSGSKPRL